MLNITRVTDVGRIRGLCHSLTIHMDGYFWQCCDSCEYLTSSSKRFIPRDTAAAVLGAIQQILRKGYNKKLASKTTPFSM